jgi:hypothetical protein
MKHTMDLYNSKLTEEGFEVRRMTKTPNLEKQRVRALYKARTVSMGNMMTITTGAPGGDSTSYYQRILRQDDMINIYGNTLLNADSLVVETSGDEKLLAFDNYIYVTFKNELEEEGYLRTYMENRKPSFQRSNVTINGSTGIVIDKSGSYFNPQHFFTSGYWGWGEKIANMVPSDFVPGK